MTEAPAFGIWQPIKTAPRDGTRVLVASGEKVNGIGRYINRPGEVFWEMDSGTLILLGATHWMPLPPPPPKAKSSWPPTPWSESSR
ncbi:hypothetical protein FV217_13330 [Methylobacterium sp. WL9]|uniref:DUF551 domain-containing protein n=1 Tax=Methylobacterium thuringiense TaxID=1003091 RepID=A0ABQ4THE8_9HYPH|nr:hypothetical protein FV217_13330 [Methylobacterium sp. WL9]GJE54809.1 hypothetical protein EKPJFOCH_1294 [Methylobacterium thuringiense]